MEFVFHSTDVDFSVSLSAASIEVVYIFTSVAASILWAASVHAGCMLASFTSAMCATHAQFLQYQLLQYTSSTIGLSRLCMLSFLLYVDCRET